MKEKKYPNLGATKNKPLIKPSTLLQQIPLTASERDFIEDTRAQISRIIHNEDDRMIVITGPCSIHDMNSALEYAELLKKTVNRFSDELLIIMRVYFEKPRTSLGWKGFINDPYLDDTFAINDGLRLARELLIQINKNKIPAGTEFLDHFVRKYISDAISWGAIGARTAESQIHRALGSSLPMPVGFKNSTDGNIQVAVDAVHTARESHHIFDIDDDGLAIIAETYGNKDSHVVLRGSHTATNYDAHSIMHTFKSTTDNGLAPKIMIDCSHGNSQKNHINQQIVVHEVCRQLKEYSPLIAGVMLESHLLAGNQPLKNKNELTYGQSITDACISWDETVCLLEKLAAAVKMKRKNRHLLIPY
ncbi:MAG: 3-deoxy-7-phosphoheptulonate synthase [Legionella sp. 40-6]|nr:3-deoxy-7-phosphoheptulonate synthase [Legionella sp.]OJY42114.1 MAG: 3-deoxy-7-phosphoheptulonate synthase [Legionella sp. 40-6]